MSTACVIVIGNEILSGRTQDSNLNWLAVELNKAGVRLKEARVVPDIPDAIIKAVNATAFDLVVANFANADMVGHSGQLAPTIKAVEAVDAQLGRIYKAIKERNGSWLITADHGNAELMLDPATGGPQHATARELRDFGSLGEKGIDVHVVALSINKDEFVRGHEGVS